MSESLGNRRSPGGRPPLPADHNRNPLTTTGRGGRLLSALQAPWFTVWPPRGYGIVTTVGRTSGSPRRTCVRAVRDGEVVYVVAIGGERTGWLRNMRADPAVELRIRCGRFRGRSRELRQTERDRAERSYAAWTGPFEFLESLAHLRGWPRRARSEDLHRHWFRTGVPMVIELH